MPFNIDYIRKLNKVRLYLVDYSGENPEVTVSRSYTVGEETFVRSDYEMDVEQSKLWDKDGTGSALRDDSLSYSEANASLIYEAVTPNGFSLNVGINYSTFSLSGWTGGKQSVLGTFVAQTLQGFGMPTAVDMEAFRAFSGSELQDLNIETFLYLRDSWYYDVFQPLNRLLEWILPSRGTILATVQKSIEDALRQGIERNRQKDTLWGDIWAFSQEGGLAVLQSLGRLYELKTPKVNQNGKRLVLKFGSIFTLRSVLVKGVSISIPTLVYDEGYPPYIKVTLTISSLRPISYDNFKLSEGNSFIGTGTPEISNIEVV